MGRPPKVGDKPATTLTIKIPTELKQQIVELADGYDMTITEYLTTLIKRDASQTATS
jgi:hypothetical protein